MMQHCKTEGSAAALFTEWLKFDCCDVVMVAACA